MAAAYHAGASDLPFAMLRGYIGTDLPGVNPAIRSVTCPFTGEQLAAVPAIRPDVSIVHAQRADREGNILVEGIVGVQKEAVLAASRSLVTVEEVVDDLRPGGPNAVILPAWAIDAIAVTPGGASPSYTHGYSHRDNAAYQAWDDVSRQRESFLSWLDDMILAREPTT
jgi:glutaconate CoA-transferase subunit A